MPNWFQKEKLKKIAPAIMLSPLGLGLMQDNQSPAQTQAPQSIEQRTNTNQPSPSNLTAPSPAPSEPVEQTGDVDVNKIIQMESSGRTKAVSPVGAVGLMQIMPPTWHDITKKIGKYQDFEKYKFDQSANIAVGSYYLNKDIPRMLKAFSLPDSIEMRLAAYNWGIGNVKKTYQKYKDKWQEHLPKETANYLKKYRG